MEGDVRVTSRWLLTDASRRVGFMSRFVADTFRERNVVPFMGADIEYVSRPLDVNGKDLPREYFLDCDYDMAFAVIETLGGEKRDDHAGMRFVMADRRSPVFIYSSKLDVVAVVCSDLGA